MYIRSWELETSSVCISLKEDASDPPMYVAPNHLLILAKDQHWRYVIETDETWYCRPLLVRIEDMYVRVSHGDRQSMKPIDEEAFTSIIPKKCQGYYSQYTYIALEIGHPFNDNFKAIKRCHITVGYVAMMSDDDRRRLEYKLNDDLHWWKCLEPSERPYAIPNYKKFERSLPGKGGYDVYIEAESISFSLTRARILLQDGYLRLKQWDDAMSSSKRPEVDEILRVVERGRLRLQKHRSRVLDLPEGPPSSREVLQLKRSDSGLDGSLEIRDLLFSLLTGCGILRNPSQSMRSTKG